VEAKARKVRIVKAKKRGGKGGEGEVTRRKEVEKRREVGK